jgi:hypothetical protein
MRIQRVTCAGNISQNLTRILCVFHTHTHTHTHNPYKGSIGQHYIFRDHLRNFRYYFLCHYSIVKYIMKWRNTHTHEYSNPPGMWFSRTFSTSVSRNNRLIQWHITDFLCKWTSGQVILYFPNSCFQWAGRTTFRTHAHTCISMEKASVASSMNYVVVPLSLLVAYDGRHPSGWKVGSTSYYGPRGLRHQHTWSG